MEHTITFPASQASPLLFIEQNPMHYTLYNLDWFIHHTDGRMERVEGLKWGYEDFAYMRSNFVYMPCIGDNSYMVIGGAVIFSPPPIYIPTVSTFVFFIIFLLLELTRPRPTRQRFCKYSYSPQNSKPIYRYEQWYTYFSKKFCKRNLKTN